MIEKSTYRPLVCPFCKRLGYVPVTMDDGTLELFGCVPCGGKWNEFGYGTIWFRWKDEIPALTPAGRRA